ncbi:MAG: xanthine dehydrogenase family protein subunit M [Chloroflexi bacterium]|nr:xanthine dehydrogenase family protein subunit M [Chloroflexota bacterium]
MKPPRFEYYDPASLDEALALLAQHGDEAKLLAGGQSLVPLLNLRLARPRVLVDLNPLDELAYVRAENGHLAIGALTRQRDLELSEVARARCPLLAEALRLVGHPTIRNRGTVGGNLAHADPASELPAVALALEAEFVARSSRGERRVPARAFFVHALTTALAADEALVEVRIPALPAGAGWAFVELARRHGDYAIAGAAAALTLDASGRIAWARLSLCGVGPVPIRPLEAERLLPGRQPGPDLWRAVGEAAAEASDPASDLQATADYRRAMVEVYVARALERAAARASES